MAALAQEHQIPFVIDLGSGNLVDFKSLGLPAEPTVKDAISNGADLVTFSGDKLLGGPQAGIIAGRADLIAKIKSNPLKRALRLDKMTLAGLIEVLKLYRNPDQLTHKLPTLRLLTRSFEDIQTQCERLVNAIKQKVNPTFKVSVEPCFSQIGSGSLPVDTLESSAIKLTPISGEDRDMRNLADYLRACAIPVIGRIHKGSLWLDLRCLETHQETELLDQLDQIHL